MGNKLFKSLKILILFNIMIMIISPLDKIMPLKHSLLSPKIRILSKKGQNQELIVMDLKSLPGGLFLEVSGNRENRGKGGGISSSGDKGNL